MRYSVVKRNREAQSHGWDVKPCVIQRGYVVQPAMTDKFIVMNMVVMGPSEARLGVIARRSQFKTFPCVENDNQWVTVLHKILFFLPTLFLPQLSTPL